MTDFVQLCVAGVSIGAIYAMTAIGFVFSLKRTVERITERQCARRRRRRARREQQALRALERRAAAMPAPPAAVSPTGPGIAAASATTADPGSAPSDRVGATPVRWWAAAWHRTLERAMPPLRAAPANAVGA